MKPGARLKSAVCDTEVMVIRGNDVIIECGGVPMGDGRAAPTATRDARFAEGTKIGKRYVDAAGQVELLCVKGGRGALSIGGVVLKTKDAKPLPSSD